MQATQIESDKDQPIVKGQGGFQFRIGFPHDCQGLFVQLLPEEDATQRIDIVDVVGISFPDREVAVPDGLIVFTAEIVEQQPITVVIDQQSPRVIDPPGQQRIISIKFFAEGAELFVVEVEKGQSDQGHVAVCAVHLLVGKHIREPPLPLNGLRRTTGILLDNILGRIMDFITDIAGMVVLCPISVEKFINLLILTVSHPDQQKMAIQPGQFVDLGEVVAPVICFLEYAGKLSLFLRLDSVRGDLFLQMDQLTKLEIDINGRQPFTNPGDNIGVLPFVDLFIKCKRLVDQPAVVIQTLEDGDLLRVSELMHLDQPSRFMGKEAIGEFLEFPEFLFHIGKLQNIRWRV